MFEPGVKLKQQAAETLSSDPAQVRRGRWKGSLLIWCNSLFPLQLSANFNRSVYTQQRASPPDNTCFTRLPWCCVPAGHSRCSWRRKTRFCAENWRKIKVEAVAPSWRPCLGATEAPPVSDSRRSRSQKHELVYRSRDVYRAEFTVHARMKAAFTGSEGLKRAGDPGSASDWVYLFVLCKKCVWPRGGICWRAALVKRSLSSDLKSRTGAARSRTAAARASNMDYPAFKHDVGLYGDVIILLLWHQIKHVPNRSSKQ